MKKKLHLILADAAAELLDLANEQAPEGWMKLCAYGEYRNGRYTQVVDREAGEALANSVNGILHRTFVGVPFYIGHPDHEDFAGKPGHDDRAAYGWLSGLEARDDGIYIKANWGPAGKQLLANAFYRWLSPNWLTVPVDGNEYRRRPVKLASIGLTNNPAIPHEAIANEETDIIMIPKELLIALGLAEDATPEAVLAAINALKQAAQKAADAKAAAEIADQAKTAAESNLANERTAHQVAIANARRSQAEAVADLQIANQQLTPAERTARIEALVAAPDEASWKALANAKPTGGPLKTQATVTEVQATTALDAAGRRTEFLSIVNEIQDKDPKLTYGQAYEKAKKDKRGKVLFQAMDKKPA
jgi:phage I-like protein